jgi:hypothetical protein
MMVNDEISDSQGIENDSILAGLDFFILLFNIYDYSFTLADVKQLDDEELLDDDV